MQCFICYQECTIPISLFKFACYKNYDIHCNSNKFMCFECYYLSMQVEEKCFFCRAPTMYPATQFYLDYKNIKKDEMVECFVCKESMKHKDLIRHLFENSTCLHLCVCGEYFTKNDKDAHYQKCPFFEKCNFCQTYHERRHDGKKICVKSGTHCMDCCEILTSENHWQDSCLYRKIKCPECGCKILAMDMIDHYSSHLKDYQNDLKEFADFYYQKTKSYQNKLNELCKLYSDIYPENTTKNNSNDELASNV